MGGDGLFWLKIGMLILKQMKIAMKAASVKTTFCYL